MRTDRHFDSYMLNCKRYTIFLSQFGNCYQIGVGKGYAFFNQDEWDRKVRQTFIDVSNECSSICSSMSW